MTDLKFKLLKHLYELPLDTSIGEADLLNSFIGRKGKKVNNAKKALGQMLAQNYVSKLHDDTYRIAVTGINVYELECISRHEKYLDRFLSISAFIVSILGIIIAAAPYIRSIFFG